MKIKTISSQKKLKDFTALIRVDYNVPLGSSGKTSVIKETYKIESSLPLINALVDSGAKVILMSHLGEPNTDLDSRNKYTLGPVAKALSRILRKKVLFMKDCVGKETEKEAFRLVAGQVALLENLRFHAGEVENDPGFARSLACVALSCAGSKEKVVYINEAFSVCHRKHASVSAIKKFLPSYAGPLLRDEIMSMEKILNPARPSIAVMGGAKISTKIRLIKKLISRYDHILIGGAMANNFYKARGHEVGESLISAEEVKLAKKLLSPKLVLPRDMVVLEEKNSKPKIKRIDSIKKGDIIFDIGPDSADNFSRLVEKANTIVWNGPLGKYEDKRFRNGTVKIAQAIAKRCSGKPYAAVGGGETVEALRISGVMDKIDWVSTGGGAMLSYLGGEQMPGLSGLVKK